MTPTQLSVSIDRASKRFAVFRDFSCVWGFNDYQTEASALSFAMEWIGKAYPDADLMGVKVVYPRITKLKMS